MGTLRLVTLTGAGQHTSFAHMARISKAHPFAEWGVLYSQATAGLENRYPTLEWLEQFATKANEKRMRIALHLCGAVAKGLIQQAGTGKFTAESERVLALASKFGRVQLNTRMGPVDPNGGDRSQFIKFENLMSRLRQGENRPTVILQYNAHNSAFCHRMGTTTGFECLVDESGGRGIEPAAWPEVAEYDVRRIGYAGGLGPDNVYAQLQQIDKAALARSFWIDAESKLRNAKDQFDLALCEKYLAEVTRFWVTSRVEKGRSFGKGHRQVATLGGMWLDWWLALSQFEVTSIVLPPKDACAATMLDKQSGRFESYRPSENAHEAIRLFAQEQIALVPAANGSWTAFALENPDLTMTGATLELAGLRAVVAKYFGDKVPKNPGTIGCPTAD